MTEIASKAYSGSNPADVLPTVKADCISSCKNHIKGWCVEQSTQRIRGCFDGILGLNDGEVKTGRAASWDKVFSELSGYENSSRNRGLFIYGMALHTITDLFAHNAFDVKTGDLIGHRPTNEADDPNICPSRYECASLAARYVISHIKGHCAGSVSDFYNVAISSAYKNNGEIEFKLGRLDQYMKAADSVYYQEKEHKDAIDGMTQPRQ